LLKIIGVPLLLCHFSIAAMDLESDGEAPSTQRTLFSCGVRRLSNMTQEEIAASGVIDIRMLKPTPRKPTTRSNCRTDTELFPPDDPVEERRGRPSTYTNWWSPELAEPILKAMKQTRSFQRCLTLLKTRHKSGLDSSSPFDKLSRSTMYKWFDKKTFKLTPKGQKYFEQQTSYQNDNTSSILSNKELLEELKIVVARQRSNGM
jgi:hypothetical protein